MTGKKLDFLSNRLNKYSIRKFTVGTASILVGASLIFGVANEEANAAEDTQKMEEMTSDELSDESTMNQSTNRDSSNQEKNIEESTQEESAPQTGQVKDETTEASSKVEQAQDKTAETAPQTGQVKDKTTEADSKVEQAQDKTAETAPKAEQAQNETTEIVPQVNPEVEKVEEKVAEAASQTEPIKEESATANIKNINDTKSAKNDYAKVANVSDSEAEKIIGQLNLDPQNMTTEALQFALINQLANEQNANKRFATALRSVSPRNTEALNISANDVPSALMPYSGSQVIEADAIANGYIKSQTDATNAPNTLSGRAWLVDHGTPSTMANGLTPIPEGTKVYLQWIDSDGAVSPTYVASTTNQLSSADGSQVGPGSYAFDLREAWIDANGKEHKYHAIAGQYYRLWIEDFQTPNGNNVSMLRQAGGFFPGSYVNSVSSSNLGQFPLIGTNMQRTGIYMAIDSTNGYMAADRSEWIHDELGPISAPSVDLNAKNSISGKVWLETGAGDYANSATGPNDNGNDPQAVGYTVVMSSLTSEGAQAYEAQVESLPESERADAAKNLLTDHPEYISATVYGETDEGGKYTLRFPDGTLNDQYIYGYVMDPEGNMIKSYSSYTSPQFRTPNSNLSWTPQTAPAQNLVANPMWYNVNFALVPTTKIDLEIIDLNNTNSPAVPGDVVNIDLTGSKLSPLPTHIEWRDKKGNIVQQTTDITSLKEGEKQSTFIVPDTATDGDIYTAYLVVGGNDVAADSFIIKITDARKYEPSTEGIKKDYGTPTTAEDVTSSVTVPGYPSQGDQPVITVDDPTQLPDGKTPGKTEVDVTVTYPDGTTDHIKVPVTVGAQAENEVYEPSTEGIKKDYGTPTTAEDVTSSVTVPGYPSQGDQPVITVDDSTQLPDGKTPGKTEVDVTVTYPDGTTDHIKVPVTVGAQAENEVYEPSTEGIKKDYGTPTTAEDVTSSVTVPGYPSQGDQPVITVDDPTQLPDGKTPGKTEVDVTVTYPDGTTDHIKVPVTVGAQAENEVYEPSTEGIKKDYGTPTTAEDVTNSVTVPGYPSQGDQPVITVDDPTQLPNGKTPGKTEVDVTVTYPDGTTDHIKVPVIVGADTQANINNPGYAHATVKPGETVKVPQTGDNTMPDGSKYDIATNQVPAGWKVSVNANTGELTVNPPKNAMTGTSVVIQVTVTYPDGSSETVPSKVSVDDIIQLPAPTVNPVDDNDTEITGSNGTPGNTIVVTFPNGSTSEGTIDENGNWKVDVPKGVSLNKGDIIIAVEKDKDGNVSGPTNIVVGENCDMSPNNSSDKEKIETPKDENILENEPSVNLSGNKAYEAHTNTAVKNSKQTDVKNSELKHKGVNIDSGKSSKQDAIKEKALPETGETTHNTTMLGTLFAAFGSLLLFRRRSKHNENK
ncbi:Rib/alpha-like domain-containing protein [Staphylococcus nepalensis]|uniref:Rib/alpha-like domain-containing protein n=1 Tax=Staphylococcus nepalensis TaxID=214473 RepID=UPI003F496A5E